MRQTRVLVVDDDPEMRRVYHRFFASDAARSFSAAIVGNGAQALRLLKKGPSDLAVLDWRLPGISGVSLAKALRASAYTRGMGILMVTGCASGDDTMLALEAGVDDYIVKPFDEGVLRSRLVNLARRREFGVDLKSLAAPLTSLEGGILDAFLNRAAGAPTRAELCLELWGGDAKHWGPTLDAGLAALHQKLGPCAQFQIRPRPDADSARA